MLIRDMMMMCSCLKITKFSLFLKNMSFRLFSYILSILKTQNILWERNTYKLWNIKIVHSALYYSLSTAVSEHQHNGVSFEVVIE